MKGILWGVLQTPLSTPRRYPLGTPHHVTLQFGVDRDDWKHLEGVVFQATTKLEAWNDKIQTVALELPGDIPCQNRTPHISVSWCEGVKPYESNLMLASDFHSKPLTQTLEFKIEFLVWEQPQ